MEWDKAIDFAKAHVGKIAIAGAVIVVLFFVFFWTWIGENWRPLGVLSILVGESDPISLDTELA